MPASDLPPGRWSALLVGDQWPGAQSLQLLATTAGARGRAADDLGQYADALRSIRDVNLGGQEGLAAEAIREMFRRGETAAREVSEANRIKSLAYESAHRWTEDLRNDLTDIAARGNADIEAINASEAPQAAKVAEILAVIDAARARAALKAAGRVGEVAGLVRTVLQQQGIDCPPGDFAATMGIEVSETRPAADPETVAQQVSGMLGTADHHLVAPAQVIAAPPPETTPPDRPAAQPATQPVASASGPPGAADTPAPATVTAPAAPQPATAASPKASAAATAPTEAAPRDVPRDVPCDVPCDVPRDVPRDTPAEPRTAPAGSVIAGAQAGAALTVAAAAVGHPGGDGAEPVSANGGDGDSVRPPSAPTVIAAAPTPLGTPPARAPVIPPVPTASPVGGLPAYGADLRPPAAAAPTGPLSPPLSPTAGSGAAGPTAVVRRPESGIRNLSAAVIAETAAATTATGAAAGATANPSPGEERVRRLLNCVARQEPRLRWVIVEREDGTTLVATDLASGWVPPHVRIPAGVALPPPSARCADLARLLGPAVRTLVHRPGDPLPRQNDAAAPMSPSARDAPPVDELGWALSRATRWRDGLPRLAHTLATAVFARTGYLDNEVSLLREHLVAVADRALARYPDATDPGEIGNWQLLATLEALIDDEKAAARYHFGWFQAQVREGEDTDDR